MDSRRNGLGCSALSGFYTTIQINGSPAHIYNMQTLSGALIIDISKRLKSTKKQQTKLVIHLKNMS